MDQIYKTDLNELFSYQRKGEKLEEKEKVIEIEIERLRDFKEHPFHVKDDKEMSLLKESIKNYGILSPLIVRPVLDGVYEIVSGHRRKYAAQQLGYYKLPVIIRVSLSEAQSSARRLTRTALPSAAPSSDCLRQTKRNLLRIPLFLPPSPMKSACSDLKMYRLEIG